MSIDASEMGRRGARSRMKKLSAKQRSEIARNAALARWRKRRKPDKKR